jgi:hypothetical protein
MRIPPIVITDFPYVRFVEDRNVDEKDFSRIQKYRVLEMKRWVDEIRKVERGNQRQKEGGKSCNDCCQ